MKLEEFKQLIEKTQFDSGMKQLFLTSYTIGFDAGRIEQMKQVMQVVDCLEFEKKIKENI